MSTLSELVDIRYYNNLPIKKFEETLDIKNVTQCYKFYWFEAILNLLAKEGKDEYSFDEIVNQMIVNSWYTVAEYHLHLGPRNSIGNRYNYMERIVNALSEASNLSSSSKESEIINVINKFNDVIKDEKKSLFKYVPYRFLSPIMNEYSEAVGHINWDGGKEKLNAQIFKVNEMVEMPYVINGKSIKLGPSWKSMFLDYESILQGWIEYRKIFFLQQRNPGVPGIIYKLKPMDEYSRKLEKVRELWKYIIKSNHVDNIYRNDDTLDGENLSIDHFVPWSYVASDELWNLIPTTRELNSSKSNKLARWDLYFKHFVDVQYMMYKSIHNDKQAHKLYNKCKSDNLMEDWAVNDLYENNLNYNAFSNLLEEHIKPLYISAKNQGYVLWRN